MIIISKKITLILCSIALVASFSFTNFSDAPSPSAETYWPRVIKTENGELTLYQVQPEKYENNIITARQAISYKGNKAKSPVFGVIWISARTDIDRDSRIVTFEDIKVIDYRYPDSLTNDQVSKMKEVVAKNYAEGNRQMNLDELLTTMGEVESQAGSSDKFSTKAPKIIYRDKPTILVTIDGDPIIKDEPNTDLKRVVNTPYIIMQDPSDKKYYINGNGLWFSTGDLMSGWQKTDNLSPAMKKADALFKEKGAIANTDSVDNSIIPDIIVSKEPTELIQTKGKAEYLSISKTNLLYASNSENNIFKDVATQKTYVLISGRWFTAATLDGPWSFIESSSLPKDFSNIPVGSDKDIVLASVAGTPQAQDAIHDAQLPQTAEVDRKTATTKVTYDGEPEFEKVDGTTNLYYAKNTESTVLKDSKKYYAVDNGVWFESDSPNGPWTVCVERPVGVDDIEPTSPVYNVQYTYIYSSTPNVVYVGYTPGYTNCYVYGGTVIYGTGYYYQPWYGTYYYPYPYTYGASMVYNPYMGWSMGFSMSYGWYGCSYGGYWGYPRYYGPPYYRPPYHNYYNHYYGGGGYGHYGNMYGNHYNHYNNGYGGAAGNKPINAGGRSYSGNVYNNGAAARTGVNSKPATRPSNSGGANTTGKAPSGNSGGKVPPANSINSNGKAGGATKGGANDVYASPNGNVYKGKDNNFQQYDQKTNQWARPSDGAAGSNPGAGNVNKSNNNPATNGGANNPARSNGSYNNQQLQQQQQSRTQGQQRSSNYNQQSAPRAPSGGGARPSGGGGARVGGGGGHR